ncbi:MAG TPA: hypothetical protein VJ846_00245 [Sphingomicrobium sp.]|nr:hypothetical protein [Sphingomicrobium sp.]
MAWSGGKDSCVALHALRSSPDYEVAALLTTVTRDYDRISMHGVHRSLLVLQAEALGLPLVEAFIPAEASNAIYEQAMGAAFEQVRTQGIETVAFGDLFLEDIRAYRDALMARNSMKAIYPVWGRDTRQFIRDFIAAGFKAVTCCIDLDALPETFAGRMLDERLVRDLPESVDPCGENGEFHTFVFDGPGFARPIPIRIGDRVTRGRFCYCDLQMADAAMNEGESAIK